MDEFDLFRRFGVALAVGLLLGLERGWHERDEREGGRIAGLRTFAVVGLLGGVSGWLAALTGAVVLAFSVLGLSGLLALSYWIRLKENDDLGLTTEVALLLTFGLGAAAVLGDPALPAATAVVAALLLTMKQRLHRWVARIDRLELDALLRLALISVVVLPLLPDRGYGPGAVLNPYEIWWAVVIVAGLSFVGYAAVRLGGADLGILLTGLFGGLASSTSTTLALSRLARRQAGLGPVAASGAVVAGSVTFLRVLAIAAIFQPSLIAPLALPMGVMAVTGLGGAAILRWRDRDKDGASDLDVVANPLDLGVALSFGALLTLVLLALHYLELWLGEAGIQFAAALSGVTDVDAITISVARLAGEDLAVNAAATAIFIAAAVNTAVKAGIALAVGGKAMGLRVGVVYTLVLTAGLAALWIAAGEGVRHGS
jgi:uncharacterized membrane protein (DUF4010 family)